MTSPAETIERVIKTLKSILSKKYRKSHINLKTDLSSLGMDSLNFLEFLLALETEFNVSLDGDVLKLNNILTVGDAVELVCDRLEQVSK